MKKERSFFTGMVMVFMLNLLFVSAAMAGFTYPAGDPNPPFEGHPIGDGTNSAANKAKIAPTIKRFEKYIKDKRAAAGQPPLSDADLAAAAQKKFDDVRKNLMEQVDMVGCQLGKAGKDCLKAIMDRGGLCIDFGNGSQGAQFCDVKPDCKKDKININITELGCSELPCYDPTVWDGAITLYEEVRHAMQDFQADGDADPCKAKAKQQLKSVCNEADVEAEELEIQCDMEDALEELCKKDGGNPDPKNPMVKKVIQKLQAIKDDAERKTAVSDLKKSVKDSKKNFHKPLQKCYQDAKAALEAYVGGTKSKAELNAALGAISWQIAGQTTPLTRVVYYADPTSGTVIQHDGDTEMPLETGLTGVYDLKVVQDGALLLFSGISKDGTGVVGGAFDYDGDGFFDESQVTMPGNPDITLKLSLLTHPDKAETMVFDGGTHSIFSLIDYTGEGIPDEFGYQMSEPREDLMFINTFTMSEPNRILGYQTAGDMGSVVPETAVVELMDMDGDGFFETIQERTVLQDMGYAPAWVDAPTSGEMHIDTVGMPGAFLEVWLLDDAGEMVMPMGQAVVPHDKGEVMIMLEAPVFLNQELIILDHTNENQSDVLKITSAY